MSSDADNTLPHSTPPAANASGTPPSSARNLLVVCLCADWCGTCRDYQPLFEQLKTEFPGARFQWVDVEDNAEVVDPVEVENFPTLLIASDGEPRFFGTVMPHVETLRRLIQAHMPGASTPVRNEEIRALARRLAARPSSSAE